MSIKKVISFLLLIVLSFSLFSCTKVENEENINLKLPDVPRLYVEAKGDNSTRIKERVNFYLPERTTHKISVLRSQIELSISEKSYEEIVNYILKFQSDNQFVSPCFGHNITLYGNRPIEVSNSYISINLNSAVRFLSESQLNILYTSLAETLIDYYKVDFVSLLVEDKALAFDKLNNIPQGTYSRLYSSPPIKDYNRYFDDLGNQKTNELTMDYGITLFFPILYGEGIIPETRILSLSKFEAKDILLSIINELDNGPYIYSDKQNIPNLENLLAKDPSLDKEEDKRIVSIHFKSVFNDVFNISIVNKNTAIAMLVYSISSFYPDVDGFRIYIGNDIVSKFEADSINEDGIIFNNSIITRADLSDYFKKQVDIYLADENSRRLVLTKRFLPAKIQKSLRNILLEICKGPVENDSIEYPSKALIPFRINDEDILAVYLSDDVLIINFSQKVYNDLKYLSEKQEKLFVFAIVNTFCSNKLIKKVYFQFDGNPVDYITGGLFFASEFVPNLNIVKE